MAVQKSESGLEWVDEGGHCEVYLTFGSTLNHSRTNYSIGVARGNKAKQILNVILPKKK